MEKIRKYFEVFKAKVKDIYDAFPDNEDIKAVYAFYQQDPSFIVGAMQKDSLWDDIAKNLNKKYSTFSFLIEGDTKIVASKTELINLFEENHGVVGNLCLITGRYSKVVEITTATKILGSKKQPNWLHFKLIPGMIRMGNLKDTMLQYQKKLNLHIQPH